jgi:hypothetical protein
VPGNPFRPDRVERPQAAPGRVNLLGGRAVTLTLHPFVYRELREDFSLLKALDRD